MNCRHETVEMTLEHFQQILRGICDTTFHIE